MRETWVNLNEHVKSEKLNPVYIYRADKDIITHKPAVLMPNKWKPSIHMPKEAARIFLRVTGVRLERVQDITEEDARAEGVTRLFDDLTPEQYRDKILKFSPFSHRQDTEPFTNYLWHGYFGVYGGGNKQSDAWPYQYSGYETAKESFSSLWELINAKRGYGWDTNPWVWVYTFERIDKPDGKEGV